MDTVGKIKTSVLSLLAIIIFLSVINFLGSDRYKSPYLHDVVQLDDGWTISFANKTYHPDVLHEMKLPVANYKDVIVLTRTLPDLKVYPATIHFRSILSTVDVYIDDHLIYDFGHDYEAKNRMLPKCHHFVTVPNDYAGRVIKIVFTAQENDAFSGLSPITFGNEEDISRAQSQDNRLSLAIGVFLVMFGFVLLILTPFFIFSESHDNSIIFSAILSSLLGFYILCFNDLFWLLSDQPTFYTFLEYFSLFSIPSGIVGFLTAAKQIKNIRIGILFRIINLGFILVTTILHLTNLVHICHFVSWLHFLAIAEGVFVIISLLISYYRKRKNGTEFSTSNRSTSVLILGLILFTGCSLIDIVKFNILKFFSIGEVNTDINFMTVGAFIFIICLVLNYFYHCIEFISETNIMHELEGLAYSDSLTDLANRSKCELILAELENDYTIVSIDLDHLKYTNDNYGHANGDKLISGFASILKNSFTDAQLIGRMGGDEFIVVLPFIDEDRTNRDLMCLTDIMSYKNNTEGPVKFSCSFGYASSDDELLGKNADAQKVYLLADTRMYKMKNKHHTQTIGRLYGDLIKDYDVEGGKL